MSLLDIAFNAITDLAMEQDLREIVRKVGSYLEMYPNTALQLIAIKLEISEAAIEEALLEVEGVSFQEFQAEKRLAQAFAQLGALSPAANGPYEIVRARRRLTIPRATVQYRMPGFWKRKSDYSSACPLVDFSCDGLALLADCLMEPQRRISLLLKFPGEAERIRVEGRIVYAVATGIAGYRYRIGVQFLPFNDRKGCNDLKSLEVLSRIEQFHIS